MSLKQILTLSGVVVGLMASSAFAQNVPVTPTGALMQHELVASGSVETAFGDAVDDSNAGLGAALTYLHQQRLGAEVIVGALPDVGLEGGTPTPNVADVQSYMVNGVAALPLGAQGRWQPFVSGGVGAMAVQSEVADELDGVPQPVDDTQLGGNIGVGLMAFADRWGFRTDLRYFTGLTDQALDTPEFTEDVRDNVNEFLNDLSFWRASAGVAYRW